MAKVLGLNRISTIEHGKPKTITKKIMQDKNANKIIIIIYKNMNIKMNQTRLWCKIIP
jgi:hypothetical protein